MTDTPSSTVVQTAATVDVASAGQPWSQGWGEVLQRWVEHAGALVTVKDAASGHLVFTNARFASWVKRDPQSLVGLSDSDVFDASVVSHLRAAEITAIGHDGGLHSDHAFEWHGQRFEFSVFRQLIGPDAAGRQWLVAVWTDQAIQRQHEQALQAAHAQIEQLQRANAQLRHELAEQGPRDVATGLYTRAHFDDQLKRELDLSSREHREFALVSVMLDPPSDKVAAMGAEAHNRILDTVGRLLRSNTRAMDAACRLDDDHFFVLFSGVGLATAHTRVEGLRRQCASQVVVLDGQEFGFTVSMGVASFPHTAASQDELWAACQAALSEAQRRGGNHVTLASIRFEPA